MKNKKNPFDIEKIRAKLAHNHNYLRLIKTYSKSNPEIQDLNTPKLWNALNKEFSIEKNPMAKDRIKIVNMYLKGHNIEVLNIGFGSANLEEEFFKKIKMNVNWFGIDIASKAVRSASRKYKFGIFKVGNINRIQHNDNSFDYVIALEVLEHIPPSDTFIALREIYRVTKHNGTLILSVPLNEGLEAMIQKGANPNAHVRIYTPELIRAELEIAGFKVANQTILYAFGSYYKLKIFLVKYILRGFRHPNNIIISARKP